MLTGEKDNQWGDITNTNLNLVQQAIAGFESIAITSTNTTLLMTDGQISPARNAVLKFTGAITANCTVFVVGGIEKTYTLENATSGAFTLALNQVGGASVIFGATDKTSKLVYLNGTDAVDLGIVNLTAPQTLTNKTLTTPVIAQINDTNGNEEVKFTTTASAVNELTIANAATGSGPEISATGGDTNIDLKLTPKGSGNLNLDGIKFPNADGTANQVLTTNGSGTLSFATVSGGAAWQAIKTTNFNVTAKEGYFVDTNSTTITATLPASPAIGDFVQFIDYSGTFDTNNFTVARNGNKIQGDATDLTVSVERAGLTLVYTGSSTQGWLLETK
jgi:hypothetical protein